MQSDQKLLVVLYWHMHQPEYRDLASGSFSQPWTYLHAIKDYSDMAAHLEAHPSARAVVNFTPILLTQLEAYERQIRDALQSGSPIRDPLLATLDAPVFPVKGEQRNALLQACVRAHPQHMIKRYPAYEKLVDIAHLIIDKPTTDAYLTHQFMADLVTWYHLVWLGESVRRRDPAVRRLLDQGAGYTLHQRRQLLSIIGGLIGSVRDRYRRLAQGSQVELTTSPYAHPIIPLLLDFGSATAASPHIDLPKLAQYPGGRERAMAQLRHGRDCFERYFGMPAAGCWPSEGAISRETLALISEAGFSWAATGAAVLRNSLTTAGQPHDIYRPYAVGDKRLLLYARDDELSDLIGFKYSNWHSDDAVADLERRLCAIADEAGGQQRIVSIILDGENAWEYYPDNAYDFLSSLYERLADHPRLRLTTYSQARDAVEPAPLDTIVSGSWVYGNLTTWIGDKDKNRAWDILGEAKISCDQHHDAPHSGETAYTDRVDEQLMVCEGSDWFWWLGDYNPAASVHDFESLFRTHVSNLYRALGAAPPDYLTETLAQGQGAPSHGGVMRSSRSDSGPVAAVENS